MPVVNNTRSLIAGIQDHLKETWRQSIPVFRKQQELLVRFLPNSNIRNAQWVWKESVPFPSRWDYGKPRQYKLFKDRYISVGKYNFELSIPWSRFDEEDDQLDDLKPHVEAAVKRYAQLPDVMLSEYFIGTASLNPAILNAYDGVGLFSTVDGDGANRFGVSSGNILSGYPLTVADVVHGVMAAQRQWMKMLDPTALKPIFTPDDVSLKNITVIGPPEANEVFLKAAESEYLRTDPTNTVSESNVLKGTFAWETNPYLTDASDWYAVLKHPYWKPFVYREPSKVESIIADLNNSDRARETGEYSLQTLIRTALAVWMPLTIIKFNN